MLAAFTMVLSGTIVNVAVPDVMGAFGVGQSEVQLMSTAFMIAMTTGQLLNAWVVAVIGQRWGFVSTLALFTFGSFVAGAAETFDMVVLGRVLQGSAAGVIQPLVMVTVFQAFPEGRRGAALGVYVMGLVGAASVGPPLGGLAIEIFNWRYIYYAPLILVAISFPLGMLFMPNEREEKPPKFDWLGYALICLALYCLMTGVSNGPREGWSSDYIVMLLIVGVSAMIAFIQSQRRAAASMLDLSLFRNKMFTMAVIVTCFFGGRQFCLRLCRAGRRADRSKYDAVRSRYGADAVDVAGHVHYADQRATVGQDRTAHGDHYRVRVLSRRSRSLCLCGCEYILPADYAVRFDRPLGNGLRSAVHYEYGFEVASAGQAKCGWRHFKFRASIGGLARHQYLGRFRGLADRISRGELNGDAERVEHD